MTMTPVIDIHHHGATAPLDAVTSFSVGQPLPQGDGLLSVGVHPWWGSEADIDLQITEIERIATFNPRVVAIGEAGIDILTSLPLTTQTELFSRQIELSERLHKPLIIHSVRAAHMILALRKRLRPVQPWAIHGFRGNPAQACQLTGQGIYLSFGQRFNPDSILAIPRHLILAETDESPMAITRIIESFPPEITPELIIHNTASFLAIP